MWKTDFQLFAETTNQLVTAESENYMVVFPGYSKRQGAGLFWVVRNDKFGERDR